MSKLKKCDNLKVYEREEQRRLQAVPLWEQGICNAEIARRLGVTRQTVSGWCSRWREGGAEALKAVVPGPKVRLGTAQREQLAELLVAGPQAAGLDTPLWTLSHIAALVQSRFGVDYHPGHVWHVLHEMGFTCQKPECRAKERNEVAINAWKEQTWPQIKKGRENRVLRWCSGTKAASPCAPACGALGRGEARRLCCAIASTGSD